MNGHENNRQQDERWRRGRALWRQMVTDKRNAQVAKLYGGQHGYNRAGLLGWLYDKILRIVAAISPTTRRLDRERRTAQEMRHSRLSRSKYNPGIHQRRSFNQRRAS